MRVLIIGACGYLGRSLVHESVNRGWEVIAATEGKCAETLHPLVLRVPRQPMPYVEWADGLYATVAGSVVIYAAGQRPPSDRFDENATHLLRWLRFLSRPGIQPAGFVLVSSNAAEQDSEYGISKGVQEWMVGGLSDLIPTATARLVHLYGSRSDEEAEERMALVDRWVLSARNSQKIRVANGVAFDMLAVEDAARAIADLALRIDALRDTVWDIGSGQLWELSELAALVAALTGCSVESFDAPPLGMAEAGRLAPRFDFQPRWTPPAYLRHELEGAGSWTEGTQPSSGAGSRA